MKLQTKNLTQKEKMRLKRNSLLAIAAITLLPAHAQNNNAQESDSISMYEMLDDVQVTAQRPTTTRMDVATNSVSLERGELFKAACCNLGESFTTNPSVDVNYNDATTGAKQIKLLGLSGTYVQMLTENIPNFAGLASPYSLGYVPGAWMKSIQVSKGSASVKNGYESITGQINIEYKKPEDEQGAEISLHGDSKTKIEANADANIHINPKLSTELLIHYENNIMNHDENDDGFVDKPKNVQYNLQNRWVYKSNNYIFHGGIAALKEDKNGGTTDSHPLANTSPYHINIGADRYEAYAKNAFILDRTQGTNIAFIVSGAMHKMDAEFGHKTYTADEQDLYGSLMFETDLSESHNLSVGLSVNHTNIGQELNTDITSATPSTETDETETVPGAYAQYTFKPSKKFTAMAGVRGDYSTQHGFFVTPRFHLKYAPSYTANFRLSAGKGYRTTHALAENNYLLTSGRTLITNKLKQEEAWNLGFASTFNIPIAQKTIKLSAEYYYTTFIQQSVIDYDSDPNQIRITNLDGDSYSHTVQVEASIPLFKGFTLSGAYRLNDVKCTYNGKLKQRPMTNRYKVLASVSYKTPLELWQFDATLQINGGGRMPQAYLLADGTPSWDERFHAYEQLSAQVTRWFRHWAIYIGAENLTNFTQKKSILGAENPYGKDFEPTLVWGPVHGRMFYLGVRFLIKRTSFE